MKHSDQGITKTQRGEEQRTDKDLAQTLQQTSEAKQSPSPHDTRQSSGKATRSGHTTKSG